jgi:quercetin dioxygenase-like cupin family protein
MPRLLHNPDPELHLQLPAAAILTAVGCAHRWRICSRAHDSAIGRVIDLHVVQEDQSMNVACRSFVAGAIAGAVLAAGVFAAPGVVASVNGTTARPAGASQPTTAAKSSSKVVLENDRVRVKEVIFAAGGGDAGMHTHDLPHVGVILTAGALVFTEPKKSSETAKFDAGSVGFREANVTHQVVNPGKAPMRVIEVELK